MSEIEQNLDNPNTDVKEYFKGFIKNKKIDELIAADNKLFSEVRNLESEKHVLVTQNYKKFVSATETINSIKSELMGFETDLKNLHSKVQKLVTNFNKINDPLDGKLKETEEIYRVKKDLKRLKFINDLPSILKNQLNAYLKDDEKKLSTLDKSLTYYEKCKEFLRIHKDNTLVKDIYNETKELIYKYRTNINDEMNMPEFNEFEIEKFEKCLSLLVKIEDDKKDLIKTFIDRYQYLLTCQFDKLFVMNEGVEEITFEIYSKIYDNYEFAINENDFLSYEKEIKEKMSVVSINNINETKNVNLTKLNSKYFKKGTFIWICKKISENILMNTMINCFNSYIAIFGAETVDNLNTLFQQCIYNFYSKVKNYVDKLDNKTKKLDSEFFREGLLSFYKTFINDFLDKINNDKINKNKFVKDVIDNNKNLYNLYLNNLHKNFIIIITENLKNKIGKIIFSNKTISEETNSELFYKFTKDLFEIEIDDFYTKMENDFYEFAKQIKSMGIEVFNKNEIFGGETSQIYLNHLISLFALFIMIIHSSNPNKFHINEYEKYFIGFNKMLNFTDIIKHYKALINTSLKEIQINYDTIYFYIMLLKKFISQQNIQNLSEKIMSEFTILKKDKKIMSYYKDFIQEEITNCFPLLYDSILMLENKNILMNIKSLFYDVNWLKINESPVTFRLKLKKYCYQLYQLKLNLLDVMDEESQKFKLKKPNIISDNLSTKNKSAIQLEMEKLQIRRMTIYGEELTSPQGIIYVLVKIFLKTVNEFIKVKKFNIYGYQQIQFDLSFVHNFFKENLVYADTENILDGFLIEILTNAEFNTIDYDGNNILGTDFISDLLKIHKTEFEELLKKSEENNNVIRVQNNQ